MNQFCELERSLFSRAFCTPIKKNIERYESLLKTKLSEVKTQYLERRLFEERFVIRILHYMRPSASKRHNPPEALE